MIEKLTRFGGGAYDSPNQELSWGRLMATCTCGRIVEPLSTPAFLRTRLGTPCPGCGEVLVAGSGSVRVKRLVEEALTRGFLGAANTAITTWGEEQLAMKSLFTACPHCGGDLSGPESAAALKAALRLLRKGSAEVEEE